MPKFILKKIFLLYFLIFGLIKTTYAYEDSSKVLSDAWNAHSSENYYLAAQLYEKHINLGNKNPVVFNNLGMIYLEKLITPENSKRGLDLIRLASIHGWNTLVPDNKGAPETTLGYQYLTGENKYIDKNPEKALQWTLAAINYGHTNAHSNLALMYALGFGVKKDYIASISHLIKSMKTYNRKFNWIIKEKDEWEDYLVDGPEIIWKARKLYWGYVKTEDEIYIKKTYQLYNYLIENNLENNKQKNKNFSKSDEIIPISSGSGFLISGDGYIISNFHVIDGCDKIQVKSQGKIFNASIVISDKKNDLSLIESKIKTNSFYTISSNEPQLSDDIFVAGFPFGENLGSSVKVTKGIISSLSGLDNDFTKIQIDAAIQPGNSGGPIINEFGHVVGIAVSKLDFKKILKVYGTIPENTNFGIKSSLLRGLLRSKSIKFKTDRYDTITKSNLTKIISEGTVYISCLAKKSSINKIKTRKTIFKNFE